MLTAAPGSFTGTVEFANCDSSGANDDGCTVIDNSTSSFGEGFNNAGGGLWVTEFSEEGIS
jgi:hypothetical protein